MAIGFRKKRKRGNYKFTEKTQSKRGIAGFVIAAVSIGIFAYVVWNSYIHEGAGSMYLGSAGVASMLLSIVAFVLSVMSLKEEDSSTSYLNMFKDTLTQEYAKLSSESNGGEGLGLAQMLYEQMKRNYGLE